MRRKPRTRPLDVLEQGARAMFGRGARSALTAVGISLGIAALTATVSVAASAAGSIADRFDAMKATMVTIRYPAGSAQPEPAAVAKVARLNGVVSVGAMCVATEQMSASRVDPAVRPPSDRVNAVAAQPEALQTLGVRLTQGRMFDAGHGARGEAVAVLDTAAARRIGIGEPPAGQMVYVDGVATTVLGIVEPPAGETRLTGAVIVPYESCRSTLDTYAPAEVVVRTRLGAASQVGHEAPLALKPEDPRSLAALVPPDLDTFRDGVEGDTRALFLGLAAVSLVIGALGVSNTTLVSVLERRKEIGLRRAIGASRRAIALQFLAESGLLGLVGGVIGLIVGVDVTAAIALAKGWLVVIDTTVLWAGPAIGAAVGMVAGVYPAYAAARISPAEMLRGE